MARVFSVWFSYRKVMRWWKVRKLRRQLFSFRRHLYGGKEDDWVKDDHECRICMAEYTPGDMLMQLPCSPLHHFHIACIQEWLKVMDQIPLIRFQLSVHCVERN